jgi:7-cyano-7-deazaguanine synthase
MRVLVLLSGGADSTTALYNAINSGAEVVMALGFNYGSKHNERELAYASKTCESLGVLFKVVDVDFSLFQSSLLKGGGDIPHGHYEDETMKSTVVPFRNGIFLAYATGIAESVGARGVVLGNHAGDHAVYPDCRPEFVGAMSKAVSAGTYEGVKLLSPFCNNTKAEIVSIGQAFGVDWEATYSCYEGGGCHCGACGTCVERREAFTEAGVEDPTEYAEGDDV